MEVVLMLHQPDVVFRTFSWCPSTFSLFELLFLGEGSFKCVWCPEGRRLKSPLIGDLISEMHLWCDCCLFCSAFVSEQISGLLEVCVLSLSLSLKTAVQREAARPDGAAVSRWVSLTKAEQLEVRCAGPQTRAITCDSLREGACEYICTPGQMSRGPKPDLDHQNDEFNCFISSFAPPLQPSFPWALDWSLHAFCGPKALVKTRHCFQSNEEKWVRVIQICEASEWCTTLMVNTENKKKQNGGKINEDGGFAVWVYSSTFVWSQEDEQLAGVAASSFFYFFCMILFSHQLTALVFVSLKLLHISPSCIYICSPDVRFSRVNKPFSRRVLEMAEAACAFNQFQLMFLVVAAGPEVAPGRFSLICSPLKTYLKGQKFFFSFQTV